MNIKVFLLAAMAAILIGAGMALADPYTGGFVGEIRF